MFPSPSSSPPPGAAAGAPAGAADATVPGAAPPPGEPAGGPSGFSSSAGSSGLGSSGGSSGLGSSGGSSGLGSSAGTSGLSSSGFGSSAVAPSAAGPLGGSVGPAGDDGELAPTERARLRVSSVPISRLLSLAVAGFAGLLCVGLTVGAQTAGPGTARVPYAVVIFGVQVLFVLVWVMAMRPPGARIVAGVGLLAAAGADAAAVYPKSPALAPLGYVAAAGFAVAALGQLVRRGRAQATESMSATLIVVIGVVSFGTLVVCTRVPGGTQALTICLTAIGVALAIARAADTVVPAPRLSPQVPRGALGVVLGAMAGTLAAAVLGKYLVGFDPARGAAAGLVVAAAAVLVDLAVGYAEAGRQMAGERPTFWLARHMQGPLGGFALAAPVAYAMGVLLLVP